MPEFLFALGASAAQSLGHKGLSFGLTLLSGVYQYRRARKAAKAAAAAHARARREALERQNFLVQQTAPPREIVYGTLRKAGALVGLTVTGGPGERVNHGAIVFASHDAAQIVDVGLNDEYLSTQNSDGQRGALEASGYDNDGTAVVVAAPPEGEFKQSFSVVSAESGLVQRVGLWGKWYSSLPLATRAGVVKSGEWLNKGEVTVKPGHIAAGLDLFGNKSDTFKFDPLPMVIFRAPQGTQITQAGIPNFQMLAHFRMVRNPLAIGLGGAGREAFGTELYANSYGKEGQLTLSQVAKIADDIAAGRVAPTPNQWLMIPREYSANPILVFLDYLFEEDWRSSRFRVSHLEQLALWPKMRDDALWASEGFVRNVNPDTPYTPGTGAPSPDPDPQDEDPIVGAALSTPYIGTPIEAPYDDDEVFNTGGSLRPFTGQYITTRNAIGHWKGSGSGFKVNDAGDDIYLIKNDVRNGPFRLILERVGNPNVYANFDISVRWKEVDIYEYWSTSIGPQSGDRYSIWSLLSDNNVSAVKIVYQPFNPDTSVPDQGVVGMEYEREHSFTPLRRLSNGRFAPNDNSKKRERYCSFISRSGDGSCNTWKDGYFTWSPNILGNQIGYWEGNQSGFVEEDIYVKDPASNAQYRQVIVGQGRPNVYANFDTTGWAWSKSDVKENWNVRHSYPDGGWYWEDKSAYRYSVWWLTCDSDDSTLTFIVFGEGTGTQRSTAGTRTTAAAGDVQISEPRLTCNCVLSAAVEERENLATIAESCAGEIVDVGGALRLIPARWTEPVGVIDGWLLTGKFKMTPLADTRETANTVRVTWRDNSDWQNETLEITSPSALKEDHGTKITADITLSATVSRFQAQALGRIMLGRIRAGGEIECGPLRWPAIQYEVGDRVKLCDSLSAHVGDFAGKYFRVVSVGIEQAGVMMALVEDRADIYADSQWTLGEGQEV